MSTPASQPPFPTGASLVSLREIAKDNWRAVVDLAPHPGQRGNLSSNARSLCEARFSPDAWQRAVYADDTPVGFLMLSLWDLDAWASVWRLMIDARYQGRGFGAAAVRLALEHVRTAHPAVKMVRLMSASPKGKEARAGKDMVEEESSPYNFYYGLGFRDVEPVDEYGEIEMGLDLQTMTDT